MIDALPKWIPKNIAKPMADDAVIAALEATFLATELYTNSAFYEEIAGMCNATGID